MRLEIKPNSYLGKYCCTLHEISVCLTMSHKKGARFIGVNPVIIMDLTRPKTVGGIKCQDKNYHILVYRHVFIPFNWLTYLHICNLYLLLQEKLKNKRP